MGWFYSSYSSFLLGNTNRSKCLCILEFHKVSFNVVLCNINISILFFNQFCLKADSIIWFFF